MSLMLLSASAFARGGGSSGRSSRSSGYSSGKSRSYGFGRSGGYSTPKAYKTPAYHAPKNSSGGHRSNYTEGAARDGNGNIKRSGAAKREFQKETGYSGGRPGYVVDHVVPLKRGGSDTPANMQWQTIEAAKAKDKTE